MCLLCAKRGRWEHSGGRLSYGTKPMVKRHAIVAVKPVSTTDMAFAWRLGDGQLVLAQGVTRCGFYGRKILSAVHYELE